MKLQVKSNKSYYTELIKTRMLKHMEPHASGLLKSLKLNLLTCRQLQSISFLLLTLELKINR